MKKEKWERAGAALGAASFYVSPKDLAGSSFEMWSGVRAFYMSLKGSDATTYSVFCFHSARRTRVRGGPPGASRIALPRYRSLDEPRIKSLELTAFASNNVQVAFGRDLSGDGDLAPGETEFTTGWDCGEWFMASPSQRFPAPPVSAAPHKVLTFSMHVDASGKPVSLAVKDGNTALAGFPVPGAVPPWLYSPAWNHLKITARGIDPAGETIQVRLVEDGARIILR